MNSSRLVNVIHNNDLGGYLGNWKTNVQILRELIPDKIRWTPLQTLPTPFQSYSFNTHDLTVLLSFLEMNLRILEQTPLSQFDNEAYSKSRVFLKTSLIVFPVILDDLAAILEFFYKKNQPQTQVPPRFSDLLAKASKGELPSDLEALVLQTDSWFPEVKDTRDDIIHHYDSVLLSFSQTEDNKNIIGHFHVGGRNPYAYEDTRSFLGTVFANYQQLIDQLLSHFDAKFADWYGFAPNRAQTILQGDAGIILWWAHKYGGYTSDDFQIIEKPTQG